MVIDSFIFTLTDGMVEASSPAQKEEDENIKCQNKHCHHSKKNHNPRTEVCDVEECACLGFFLEKKEKHNNK